MLSYCTKTIVPFKRCDEWSCRRSFFSLSLASLDLIFAPYFLHSVFTSVVRWDVRPPVWVPRIPNAAAAQRDTLRHHYWLLWQGQGQHVFQHNILLLVVSVVYASIILLHFEHHISSDSFIALKKMLSSSSKNNANQKSALVFETLLFWQMGS